MLNNKFIFIALQMYFFLLVCGLLLFVVFCKYLKGNNTWKSQLMRCQCFSSTAIFYCRVLCTSVVDVYWACKSPSCKSEICFQIVPFLFKCNFKQLYNTCNISVKTKTGYFILSRNFSQQTLEVQLLSLSILGFCFAF